MQCDLNRVYEWAKQNNMTFNSDKFELLRFKINELNLSLYHTPDKSIIKEVACVRDLGVHIDSRQAQKLWEIRNGIAKQRKKLCQFIQL